MDLTRQQLADSQQAATTQAASMAQQAEAADRAAAAMKATADATLTIGERRSRAYVMAVGAKYLSPKVQPAFYSGGCPEGHIAVRVRNAGQTAAKNIVVWTSIVSEGFGIREWSEVSSYPRESIWRFKFASLAPSSNDAETAVIPVPKGMFIASSPEPKPPMAVVRGEIRYSDVHGKRYRTCFIYSGYRGLIIFEEAVDLDLQSGWMDVFEEVDVHPQLDS